MENKAMFHLHCQRQYASDCQLLGIMFGESCSCAQVLLVDFPLGHWVGHCKNRVQG